MACLGRQEGDLRSAIERWQQTRSDAANAWRDEVYGDVDRRYLGPIADEHRQISNAVTTLGGHLDRVLRLLDS
jgi:hypothetical protein